MILALACTTAGAQEKPIDLPKDLAELLTSARDDLANDRAQKAVDRLTAFKGKDHALRHLLLGHAYAQQSKLDRAAEAYRAALALDKKLRQAGISLAQVLVRGEKWAQAIKMFGRFTDIDTCGVEELFMYTHCARQVEDGRLCELLVRKGVVRFPGDERFRRLDLAIMIDSDDDPGASKVIRLMLRKKPTDSGLWQQLAFVSARMERDSDRTAALEADLLCNPGDLARHRRFLGALLASGDWLTAVRHGESLLSGGLTKKAAADKVIMELLIRAADTGTRDALCEKWLALVPEKSHTRAMRIAATRTALRRGRTGSAREALDRLIEEGETDASVFLWAGHLAEQQNDLARAETLYGQARTLKGQSARSAELYLARLMFRNNRLSEAKRILGAYLNTYAEDSSARALLSLVNSRIKER
jgi:predicted Zn-dependent protease